MKIEARHGIDIDAPSQVELLCDKTPRRFEATQDATAIIVDTRWTSTYKRRRGFEPLETYHWYRITLTKDELLTMLAHLDFVAAQGDVCD